MYSKSICQWTLGSLLVLRSKPGKEQSHVSTYFFASCFLFSCFVVCCCSRCLSIELWFLKIDFFFFFSFVFPSFLLVAAVDVCLSVYSRWWPRRKKDLPAFFFFFFSKKACFCNLRCLRSAQNLPSKIPHLLESRSASAHTGSWQVVRWAHVDSSKSEFKIL
jgi:hypothetical protein